MRARERRPAASLIAGLALLLVGCVGPSSARVEREIVLARGPAAGATAGPQFAVQWASKPGVPATLTNRTPAGATQQELVGRFRCAWAAYGYSNSDEFLLMVILAPFFIPTYAIISGAYWYDENSEPLDYEELVAKYNRTGLTIVPEAEAEEAARQEQAQAQVDP